MNNLSRLQQRMGRVPLERVVGKDNLDTLFRVAELNRTGTARAKFGVAIKPVVNGLMSLHVGPIAAGAYLGHMAGMPYEVGGAAGWATAAATRRVMDAVLTNPKVAQNLIFAIDSGANPDHYGPMLATMIQQQGTGVRGHKPLTMEQLKGLHDLAVQRSRRNKETEWMRKSWADVAKGLGELIELRRRTVSIPLEGTVS
jgi:hypothetical protein